MLLVLTRETLSHVFTFVERADLNNLLRTSRDTRITATEIVRQRLRLTRSVFYDLVKRFETQQGYEIDVGFNGHLKQACILHQYEEYRHGRLAFSASVVMRIFLTEDHVRIEIDEDRDVEGVEITGDYAPVRTDVITLNPGEDMVEPILNLNAFPNHPMPKDVFAYVRNAQLGQHEERV